MVEYTQQALARRLLEWPAYRRAIDAYSGLLERGEKAVKGILGPAYEPTRQAVSMFEPMQDLRTMQEGGSEMVEGVKELDPKKAGIGLGKSALGFFSMAGPGDEAADLASKAIFLPALLGASKAGRRQLELAKRMRRAGASDDEIWDVFKVYNDPGDIWKREIDDRAMRINTRALPDATRKGQIPPTVPIADVVDHPELFRNVPDLLDLKIGREYRPGKHGSFNPATNELRILGTDVNISSDPTNTPAGILTHELSHSVARHFGWPPGSSTEAIKAGRAGPALNQAFQRSLKRQLTPMDFKTWRTTFGPDIAFMTPEEKLLAYRKYVRNTVDVQNELLGPQNLHTQLSPMAKKVRDLTADDLYYRGAGEAEARNAAYRDYLRRIGDERGYQHPHRTLDVPIDRQIGHTNISNEEVEQAMTAFGLPRETASAASEAISPGRRFVLKSRREWAEHLAGNANPRSNARASGPYVRRGGPDVEGDGRIVFEPDPEQVRRYEDVGLGVPRIEEIDAVAEAQRYHDDMATAMANHRYGAQVEIKSPEELRESRLFRTEHGSGFAIKPDGDVVAVFANTDAPRGNVYATMQAAIAAGGTKLDAFDTMLPKIYETVGFRPVARVKWNDEFAPPRWDKEVFKAFNNGEPDVLLFVYDPDYFGGVNKKDLPLFTDWDRAAAIQSAELRKLKARQKRSASTNRR